MRLRASLAAAVIVVFASVPLVAIDADRDFSGRWVLDPQASNLRALPSLPERLLVILQNEQTLNCTATADDRTESRWTFSADGAESRYPFGKEQRKTVAKWEGPALLLNTLVTGPPDYAIMDRWQLAADRSMLTMERQIVGKAGEADATVVYRREGQTQLTVRTPPLSPPAETPRAPKPESAAPVAARIVVPAGTHIPLTLVNALNTKQSHDGDGVYLETAFPVFANGRTVIPRGSYVQGIVTKSPAAKSKSKDELYIRFDSLTLPNGVSRDFRARLDQADRGKVDPAEGTITGDSRSGASKAGTVARDGGMGAGIGSLGGLAAGHMGMGVGLGAAAGGVAGLASVLSHRKDGVVLPRGASLEMVLDRDLVYTPEELRF